MKYPILFLVLAAALTLGALATFDRIERAASARAAAGLPRFPSGDTLPTAPAMSPIMPTRADYAGFAAADSAWRAEHARAYSIAELRKRGDGRRTARELMQDRVFEYSKRGRRGAAIAELERWVASHRRDSGALLSLARLLNENGQVDAAIIRYRQVLALGGAVEETGQ
jgi:hypothetical protein